MKLAKEVNMKENKKSRKRSYHKWYQMIQVRFPSVKMVSETKKKNVFFPSKSELHRFCKASKKWMSFTGIAPYIAVKFKYSSVCFQTSFPYNVSQSKCVWNCLYSVQWCCWNTEKCTFKHWNWLHKCAPRLFPGKQN